MHDEIAKSMVKKFAKERRDREKNFVSRREFEIERQAEIERKLKEEKEVQEV